jgi:hypothetical protein
MTEAPLPLHISNRVFDQERKPAPPEVLPSGAANGVADGQEGQAGGSVTAGLTSAPVVAEDPSALNGSAADGGDAQQGPSLVPPDTSIVTDATRGLDLPTLSLASEPPPESQPPPAVEPAPETFAAAEITDPPAGHVEPPAEILMEVSPIFSALDAAEKAAAEVREQLASAAEPVDYPILPPQQPSLDGLQPNAPELLAPEPVSTELAGTEPIAAEPIAAEPAASEPVTDVSTADELLVGDMATTAEEDEPEQQDERLHDAAAKIALEANATAEALESLKRLLNQKLPLLDPVPITPAPPVAPVAHVASRPAVRATAPPSIPAYQLPAQPVKPPPMVPLAPPMDLAPIMARAPVQRRSSLGGFLAGFALSGVFGVMLYVYLILG